MNAYAPVKPSEFAVLDNTAYAFTTPDGLTCMMQRSGGYGCSGPIPGAPEGANLVSGTDRRGAGLLQRRRQPVRQCR